MSNKVQKKIIKALAEAPATALKELLKECSDPVEKDLIKRIAEALGIKIE